MGKYQSVSIPTELLDTIEEYIKNSKLGFRNRSEFIISAIRKALPQKEGETEDDN